MTNDHAQHTLAAMTNLALRRSISRQLLIDAATKRGLTIEYIGRNETVMKLKDSAGHVEYCIGTLTSRSASTGNKIALDKQLTIDFIHSLGFSVPETVIYSSPEQGEQFIEQQGTIVVKPKDGSQSIGVTMNVTNPSELQKAIDHASSTKHRQILLQKQLVGKSYRLFVLNGKLVAAAYRRAAEVIGDGQSTLEALINELNTNPLRTHAKSTPLEPIDPEKVEVLLGRQSLANIPAKGESVQLSPIESMSMGGEAANVTDQVHSTYAHQAETIATALGLFTCGFDMVCDDIANAPVDNYFPVIEINSKPGLKPHYFPTAGGEPVPLADMIIAELFNY